MSSGTIADYEILDTVIKVTIAVVVLLTYDWAITLSEEINFFWRSKTSGAAVIYFFTRYLVLLSRTLAFITLYPMSDESCQGINWLNAIIGNLGSLPPAIFSAIRVYALTRQNKYLASVIFGLALAPFLTNMIHIHWQTVENLPPPFNCLYGEKIDTHTLLKHKPMLSYYKFLI